LFVSLFFISSTETNSNQEVLKATNYSQLKWAKYPRHTDSLDTTHSRTVQHESAFNAGAICFSIDPSILNSYNVKHLAGGVAGK